jgi:hypothetical protein
MPEEEPVPLELPLLLPVPKSAPPSPNGEEGHDDEVEPRSRVIVIELA